MPRPAVFLGPTPARRPFLPRHAHPLALDDLDDDRIAVGAKIARVLVTLADLERHRPNPVQEGRVVERLEHGGKGRVAPFLSIEAGIGEDLVARLTRLAAFVLNRRNAPRA